ncbi:MAG: hypothetical protein KatS3mg127_0408 [Silanimonas sp.]|nr:MAG: hypothetical protein KatS3mg127_0408 [Silanimonas sp.]
MPRPALLALPLLAGFGLFGAGCTFVPIQPGGEAVRVAAAGTPLSCERRGEIAVSVKDRVGPISRSELKVRDELEVLARNEAPGLGADTVQPLGEPRDGEQRFAAYRCGGAVVTAPATTRPRVEALPEGEAEVVPLRED